MRANYATDFTASGAQNFGNMVLYRMCKDEPRHNIPEVVTGKLWLIGRAYAASPQRGAGEAPEGASDDFFEYLAQINRESWLALDAHLDQLTETNEFSAASLPLIVRVHWEFMNLVSEAIRTRRLQPGRQPRSNRSFASKYLHFHRPDHFPIYDSYVTAALSRETKKNDLVGCPEDRVDPSYAQLCRRILAYRASHPQLTLRQLDQRLYDIQRMHLKVRKTRSSN